MAISEHSEGGNGQLYADYCYRPDGRLARLRSVPETQTDCDSVLFHCKVTIRGERLYPPSGELAKLSTKRAEKRPSFVEQLDELSLNALAVRQFGVRENVGVLPSHDLARILDRGRPAIQSVAVRVHQMT